MVQKAITEQAYADLEKHLGKQWADYIANAAETQGKALEEAGMAFKMPMEDDEEEKPEDKQDEEEMEKATVSKIELVLFSGLKEASESLFEARKEIAALQKTVSDLDNQLAEIRNGQGDTVDSVRRMTEYMGQLTQKQPASQSPFTQYQFGKNPTVDKSIEENQKGDQPVPVFNQMKQNAGIVIPSVSDNQNSG